MHAIPWKTIIVVVIVMAVVERVEAIRKPLLGR